MTRTQRDRRTRRRGGTAVETAIVINLLFVVLLGVFENGRVIMIKQLMENAAREGSRLAVVNTSSTSTVTTSQIQDTVKTYMAGQTYNNLNTQVFQADPVTGNNVGAWNTTAFGSDIGVHVDLDFVPIFPTFGSLPHVLHLTARSMMRSEAN